MKRIVLSAVALVAAAGAATAADLGYKAPPMPYMPAGNWSGCYVGGHAGGAWGWSTHNNTDNTTAFGDFDPGQGFANSGVGFAGGGQIGCNYQAGQMVYGIESTYTAADLKGDYTSVAGIGDDLSRIA